MGTMGTVLLAGFRPRAAMGTVPLAWNQPRAAKGTVPLAWNQPRAAKGTVPLAETYHKDSYSALHYFDINGDCFHSFGKYRKFCSPFLFTGADNCHHAAIESLMCVFVIVLFHPRIS
jgi:hypothetical protein